MVFTPESPSLPKAPATSSSAEDQLGLSSSAHDSEFAYIPKPPGEFNRPSNGYTLETLCKNIFQWDDELWLQVQASSHEIVTTCFKLNYSAAGISCKRDGESV
jgi:hypothetical protein